MGVSVLAAGITIMNQGVGSTYSLWIKPTLSGIEVDTSTALATVRWIYGDESFALVTPSSDGWTAAVAAKGPVGSTFIYALYTNSNGMEIEFKWPITIVDDPANLPAPPDVDGFDYSIDNFTPPVQ
jgi:hypothetical protein